MEKRCAYALTYRRRGRIHIPYQSETAPHIGIRRECGEAVRALGPWDTDVVLSPLRRCTSGPLAGGEVVSRKGGEEVGREDREESNGETSVSTVVQGDLFDDIQRTGAKCSESAPQDGVRSQSTSAASDFLRHAHTMAIYAWLRADYFWSSLHFRPSPLQFSVISILSVTH